MGRPTTAGLVMLLILALARGTDAAEPKPSSSVTLPLNPRLGRIHIPVVINGSTPHWFLLDTGYTIDMIRPSLAESLDLPRAGRIDIIGIAGRERARLHRGAELRFGDLVYRPRRLAALPSQDRRRRGGILGGPFFQRFVVEIRADQRRLTLHDPANFQYAGEGEVLSIEFRDESPTIETVLSQGEQTLPARFEIDTGCDGTLCMDGGFARLHPWLRDRPSGRSTLRRGVGGQARSASGRIDELCLGDYKVRAPRVNFFESDNLTEEGVAGHIGFAALEGFAVILDYPHRRMILERAAE